MRRKSVTSKKMSFQKRNSDNFSTRDSLNLGKPNKIFKYLRCFIYIYNSLDMELINEDFDIAPSSLTTTSKKDISKYIYMRKQK